MKAENVLYHSELLMQSINIVENLKIVRIFKYHLRGATIYILAENIPK